MERISVRTNSRLEIVDITALVQKAVAGSGVSDGICLVFSPHTTAGISINENADPSVKRDIIEALHRLIPQDAGYVHGEGNSDSHIKSSLFGSSASVCVEQGRLVLGTWQGIYLCENDGPRGREVWVKVVGTAQKTTGRVS